MEARKMRKPAEAKWILDKTSVPHYSRRQIRHSEPDKGWLAVAKRLKLDWNFREPFLTFLPVYLTIRP